MRHVEAALEVRGCPKVNLQVRASNHAALDFYRRIGYANDDVVSLGRRLIPDVWSGSGYQDGVQAAWTNALSTQFRLSLQAGKP